MGPKKLYRTKYNKIVAGVCNGIAEYFNIDVNIVRIITFLIILGTVFGFLAYLAAAFILPKKMY